MARCANCGIEHDGLDDLCGGCQATVQATLAQRDRALNDFADGALPPVAPGDVLEGKWRVESRLGQGGMGVVVLAHELALDRKVAVKLLSGDLCLDEDSVARFEREARLTAKLEHPNIVPVFAVGRHGKRPFIVMKYLDGMPLSRYLRVTPMPLPQAEVLSIMRQLCEGVALVHANGFVHRDIKPANVFIGPTGHATLLDFGILRDQGHSLTGVGMVMGTPAYLAPEMLRGEPVDHRSDLFALGVLLYELLSGARPFPAPTLEAAEIQMRAPAPQIRQRAPWIPRDVAQVVSKAISLEPDQRYQSARELWEALDEAYQSSSRAGAALDTPPKRPRWVLAAGALVVLLVAGGGIAAWRSGTTPVPTATVAPAPAPAAAEAVAVPPPAAVPNPSAPPREDDATGHPPARPKRSGKNVSLAKVVHTAVKPAAPATTAPEPAVPGTLRVVTLADNQSTWASLEVDSTPRGGTPMAMELAPGRHHVRVTRAGFQNIERDVEVSSGKQTVIRLDLLP